jgi:lysophospholipase L1-like esterase
MNKIVFYGDSLIEYYPLYRYYKFGESVNLGFAGYTANELSHAPYTSQAISESPNVLVYLAGTNDMSKGLEHEPEDIVKEIIKTLEFFKKEMPDCDVYVCSLLPCWHEHMDGFTLTKGIRSNEKIQTINALLKDLDYPYIDLFNLFYQDGKVLTEYYQDSLHVNEKGYDLITKQINKTIK